MEEDAGRPEEFLNSYVKHRIATGKIASGLGVLALLWSTVVLLGGFVNDLPKEDFWIVTLLSLVMACKMVKNSENEISKGIYMEEPKIIRILRRHKWNDACGASFTQIILLVIYIAKLILFSNLQTLFYNVSIIFTPVAEIIVVLRGYKDAGVKLTAALSIFYVLSLLQSLAIIYWLCIVRVKDWSIRQVASATNKRCGFDGWGSKVIRMYAKETTRKFHKDGELPGNWNLITYAVGLLQSQSASGEDDDHLWGARVLDTLFAEDASVRQELLSSRLAIQNLMAMIIAGGRGGTVDSNIESRERAARIVAQHLARYLHITQFPGTLQCIHSMLEICNPQQAITCPTEKPEQGLPDKEGQDRPLETVLLITDQNASEQVFSSTKTLYGWIKKWYEKADKEKRRFLSPKYRHPYESRGSRELISQGLLILEGLTQDRVNCTEISRHQLLIYKITSPLSCHDLFSNVWDDDTMVGMVSKSLTVLSRLLTSPGDGATRLHHELANNTEAVSNLMSILETDTKGAQEMHEQALEILTELAFDDSFTKPVFGESTCMLNKLLKTLLRRIFLEEKDGNTIVAEPDRENATKLRGKAGEALARLLPLRAARGANVAGILSKEVAINLLTKVLHQILSSKMGTSADAAPELADSIQPHTQGDEKQSEERKFMAAMLSLAVVMCNENVISREDFAQSTPEDAALAKKLKEIMKVNKQCTTECLRVVKLNCQMVIAMIQAKPSCIQYFNEHNFKEALTEALGTMAEVDNCMLFTGNEREVVKPARSLASLVKEARELLNPAQEQGN